MCRACHNASADSRVAMTTRCSFRPAGEALEDTGISLKIKYLARFAILACALSFGCAVAALPQAENLAVTAKQAQSQRVPVLLVFTQRTCPYCAAAKRDYLEPMNTQAPWRDRVLMREVDIDSTEPVTDFDGTARSQREIARRFEVKSVPTLIVVDATGNAVGSPIVGLLTADFYRLYIEQAIEAGLVQMRTSPR